MKLSFLFAWLASSLLRAEPLTLSGAVKQALERHPSLEAASAGTRAAASRVEQAKAGAMPRVQYSEQYQTSNNPVFAFGTLLNQRRFSQSNFAIEKLNSPGFVHNFQSQLRAEQTLYDFGAVKSGVRAAEAHRKISEEEERRLRMVRIAAVAVAYHGAAAAAEMWNAAKEAVKSAEADLARARAVFQSGMSTQADVLSIEVHRAAMKEQEIRRGSDGRLALAALNEAIGLPLDTELELVSTLQPASPAAAHAQPTGPARPELREAAHAIAAHEAQASALRAARLPRIVARGVFEADRGQFVRQAGANWYVAAGLEWNLFTGGADRQRIAENAHLTAEARARERELKGMVGLEVKRAEAELGSAFERIAVTEAVVSQAEESLRIIKNRYEAGLARVDELLRGETALVEARTRRLAALHDQRVAAVSLELAKGTLTGDSDVLR